MKIALIAPPFISVPPKKYGGTELFVAALAKGLQEKGMSVVLYANGASTAPVETRWIFEKEEWPIHGAVESNLKGLTHSSWAVRDAADHADIIHLQEEIATPHLASTTRHHLPCLVEQIPEEIFMAINVTPKKNGPYLVTGDLSQLTLSDADGNRYDLTGKQAIALCRCGASVNKPFCDGTHSKIGFQAAEAAVKAQGQ